MTEQQQHLSLGKVSLHSPAGQIDRYTSENFRTAKVCAILVVAAGHYYKDTVLWIPSTIGLFVFAFSSAYFTYLKYHGLYSRREFWKKKIVRLVPNILVINLFLSCLFILEKKSNIWTWQSLVNIAGLNGFLNWFGIPNASPFGHGLWFFTLLLSFYFVYPLFERLCRNEAAAYILLAISWVITYFLAGIIVVGHALWFTIWGFVAGVFVARSGLRMPHWLCVVGVALAVIMIAIKYYWPDIKLHTYWILLLFSVSIVFWLLCAKPAFIFPRPASFLSGCILEIYFIHTYLFYKFSGYRAVDFAVSMLLIIIVAKCLERCADFIKLRLSAGSRIVGVTP